MKTFANSPNFVRKSQTNAKRKAFKNAQRRATEAKGIGAGRVVQGPVPTIELYQREDCSISHAIRNHLTRLGLDFVAHTVPPGNSLKHEQLVRASGKDQVPFFLDHSSGVKLHDQSEIIVYLDNVYGKPQASMIGRIANSIDSGIRSRADQIAWAVRTPLEKASEMRDELTNAWSTLRGSLDFVRSRIRRARQEAPSPSSRRSSSPNGRARGSRSRPVHVDISSVTEAA
jgi:glutathione S-transferase